MLDEPVAERRAKERGVAASLEEGATGALEKWGAIGVGLAVPLVCYSANMVRRRRSPALSVAGALAVLAGGFMMREAILRAGNRSARRPADYFRFTQPEVTAEVAAGRPPPRRVLDAREQPRATMRGLYGERVVR